MDEQLWKVVGADGTVYGPMKADEASALHLRLDRESPDGPTIKMIEELDAALEVPVPLFERVR
ncbi:hypothetical protein [Paraburkholderia caledonica]|uniref:Uncharacterized protein n=1 Tax=Paraburkholderia caledonica TaxID=134536 RepID=A0ABU1L2E5_9BURK|nr:hypothetical protein [Paraburkholderia caledonica]MDR6377322.1 hypothetical protein [Paraburkholderia caledonica]